MSAPRYAYRLGWRSLRYVVPSLTADHARHLADELGPAFHAFHINTGRRAAMCVAQLAHESDAFRAREEYATGREYEGRRDLGNVHPGDGVRFKGRTYIQITGHANYAIVSKALHHDFVLHPHDLALPRYAALGACWWWSTHGLNEIADSGDFVTVTRRINGGVNGLAAREAYYARARRVAPFLIPKRRRP
jgi:putative chitinase